MITRAISLPAKYNLSWTVTHMFSAYISIRGGHNSAFTSELMEIRCSDPTGRLAAKIARKESLSLKLALRPDRQELINRNILQLQTDNERQETKEAIGAKLIR